MRRLRRDIILALVGVMASGSTAAAELRISPTLGISEDVTDNAFETSSRHERELLTVVQPGVTLKYLNTSSQLDALYHLDYYYYAEKTQGNEISHTLALAGTFSLVQQFLKLDISDTFSRISLDIARDTTSETGYYNQTDQNTATVSPYLQWRFSDKTELKTGGRYSDIRYWTAQAVDRRETGAFLELNHQLSTRLSLAGRYVFNNVRTSSGIVTNIDGYRNHDVSAGFRYEYAERSALYGTIGNSWQHYSDGTNLSNLIWDAGISNQFSTAVATLEAKRRYIVDPLSISQRQTTYSFRVDKIMPRGTLGLSTSYDEYAASDSGSLDRHGVTVSATGTRELLPNLTSSLTITGDKLSRRASVDYPYHLRGTATLLYSLGQKTSVDLTYTHATYRYHLDQSRDSVEVNRGVVQLRRTF